MFQSFIELAATCGLEMALGRRYPARSVPSIRRRLNVLTLAVAMAAATLISAFATPPRRAVGGPGSCTPLSLPIVRITDRPAAYEDFCRRYPRDCEMTGDSVLPWSPALIETMVGVNREVNACVRPSPDRETFGEEEFWAYPMAGRGDCEDMALEKRRRLVEQGLPRAALTIAIVWHRRELYSHALLLVETNSGTFALDTTSDTVACWNTIPFNFEAREQPDGLWARFDQSSWTFDANEGSDATPKAGTRPSRSIGTRGHQ